MQTRSATAWNESRRFCSRHSTDLSWQTQTVKSGTCRLPDVDVCLAFWFGSLTAKRNRNPAWVSIRTFDDHDGINRHWRGDRFAESTHCRPLDLRGTQPGDCLRALASRRGNHAGDSAAYTRAYR